MSFCDVPIELVAQIAMYNAKTWASMLFVFRGLRAEYFTQMAYNRFVRIKSFYQYNTLNHRIKKTDYVHSVYVGDRLHSIGNRPAYIKLNDRALASHIPAIINLLPRLDLFSGEKCALSRYHLEKDNIHVKINTKITDIGEKDVRIHRAVQAFYDWWHDLCEVNYFGGTWGIEATWYNSRGLVNANGAFCVTVLWEKRHNSLRQVVIAFDTLAPNIDGKCRYHRNVAKLVHKWNEVKCYFNPKFIKDDPFVGTPEYGLCKKDCSFSFTIPTK